MEKIKLLIADDHQLLIDGIHSLLSGEESITIIAKASNGQQALDTVLKTAIDVCLLDISMPGMDGIETAKRIKYEKPGVKIIILTTYNDREIVEEMIEIGVSGYMLKNSTQQELVEAITKVYNGGMYFSREVQESLMENYVKLNRQKNDQDFHINNFNEHELIALWIARRWTVGTPSIRNESVDLRSNVRE